ncbi:MAG: TIGR03936 family radical SAM-associated protein [Isosphaeraceae bacterium]
MSDATKVRLRFAKQGDLRLVSHHDLLRCLERLLRRAEVPVAHSQGFNPRPKVVFALALALGVEGRREILEIDLAEPVPPDQLLERLRAEAPPGLEFLSAEVVPPGRPAHARAVSFAFDVPAPRLEPAREAVARFLACESWPYTRHRPDRGRDVPVDLRPFVLDAGLEDDGTLRFRLKITPNGSARPEEVLDALGLRDLLGLGSVLARTDMELAEPPNTLAESASATDRTGP